MFRAINKDGFPVYAEQAKKDEEYFCPCCGEQLIFKKGKIVLPHFAHSPNSLCDEYDEENEMSAWHIAMQNQFSEKNREVIVEYQGEKHRADVLIDETVIEFQHSPISIGKFENRTDFYLRVGYRIVWVFDMSNRFAKKQIYERYDPSFGNQLHWNNALAIFNDYLAPQYWNKNMSVCFFRWEDSAWYENPYDCEASYYKKGYIYKVQWASERKYKKGNWNNLIISKSCGFEYTDMSDDMDIEKFFRTSIEYIIKEGCYNVNYSTRV